MMSPDPSASGRSSPERPPNASNLRVVVIVAVLALCVAILAEQLFVARSENGVVRQRMELAELALKASQSQLEAEHIVGSRFAEDYGTLKAQAEGRTTPAIDLQDVQVRPLLSRASGETPLVAVLLWHRVAHEGALLSDHLPPSAANTHYELWIMNAKPALARAFTVGDDGHLALHFRCAAEVDPSTKIVLSRESTPHQDGRNGPSEVLLATE